MSVDYVKFMESKRAMLRHLKDVFLGVVDEQELDHSQQVMTLIPVLLKSEISLELRSFLLRQYVEIKGYLRDQSISQLNRKDFYEQAAEVVASEEDNAAAHEAYGEQQFRELVGYLDDATATSIQKNADEHELFKSQMPYVIKSSLGMAEDDIVGPEEIKEFEEKDREF